MKKLFLYILILSAVFFLAYESGALIYRYYYENKKNVSSDISDTDFSEYAEYTVQPATVYENIQETAGPADAKKEDTEENPATDNAIRKKYQFRLSYSGGYVVVVDPDGILFEYTDIERQLLPENIQNEINRGMYFDDLKEVYDYLESIAS